MAQLERPQRQVDASLKTPTINTTEQLLRGEGSHSAPNSKSKLSPTCSPSSSAISSSPSSPFFSRLRHRDTEEDNSQNQKKSVLTKVKEKAKKLRHSLSKKKQEDGNANSPTSGAILEGDGAEEDAEYRGAPVYESEKAPAGYKENGTLHSRATSAVPEKHVMSNYDKQNREKSLGHSQSMRTTQPKTTTSKAAAAATTTLPDRNKTTAKNVAEKLKPAHFEGSDAAKALTSKLQDLTVSKSAEHHTSSSLTAAPLITHHFSSSIGTAAPRTPPAKLPSQTSSISTRTSSPSAAAAAPPPSPSSAPPIGKSTSPTSSQLWDKGVSMKEYFLNKFEPGEDDKALSKVISEAMSPKRTPGDAGVMEKVREAVTSLLRNEQPNKYVDANTTITSSSQTPASSTATRASSQLPVSSNAQEVAQEENHGRILQAN
ncbi:uncharacterized protein LOC130747278 isoform X2 [Lotus japonicus]|uniref:uncharacterized protein LOC130747278 isoform X2 n=1 Tax=Lotus japonicus TaxID=34305 RepID=UPI0025858B55|nr:uncharacterized protein LOC130747278 isoform X2 [Lotus japonicus]